MRIENEPYAEWLEEGIRTIFEGKPVCICIVATLESGETATGYYNSSPQDKAVFCHHIQSDILMDLISENAYMVREALANAEEDDQS